MTMPAAPAPEAPPSPNAPAPGQQRGSSMRQALAARDASAESGAEIETITPQPAPKPQPRQARPQQRAPEPEPPANEALGEEELAASEDDPEVEAEVEAAQEEAQADLLEKLYFGDLKGRDLLAALESGVISRELFQKLGELAIEYELEGEGGRKSLMKLALKDVPRNGMRQADYSRKTAEVARREDEAKAAIERSQRNDRAQRAQIQAWLQDPMAMYRDARRMGLGKSILQISAMLADRYDKASKMPGREGEFFLKQIEHDEADEDRRWNDERRQQQQQHQAQQQRLQQIRQATQAAYQQFVPSAVEAAGLNMRSKAVRHFLGQNLDAIQGDITQQAVADAVAATVQDLDDFIAQHGAGAEAAAERLPAGGQRQPARAAAQQRPVTAARQAQQPAQQQRALPPGRMPGGGAAAARPAQGQRGSIRSFQQKFLKRGQG